MSDHIAELKLYFSQLETMGVQKDESLQISILLESVRSHPDYVQLVEVLRISADVQQTWKAISRSLITTYTANIRRKKTRQDEPSHSKKASAAVAGASRQHSKTDTRKCTCCGRSGHLI